jgi:hypothetical protein
MLYDQLVRINELDGQIADMQKSLADLYSQRAVLLDRGHKATTAPTLPKATRSQSVHQQAKATHDALTQSWATYKVKLPAFKLLQSKLEKTCRLVRKLEADNTALKGKLVVVAVPPTKALLAAAEASPVNFVFSDERLEFNVVDNKSWSFVVIMDPKFAVAIYSLSRFLETNEYWYEQSDCRALGVAELMAAELQGIPLTDHESWTVLLRDLEAEQAAPCAIRHGNSIVFDLDDIDSLLGTNYLHPAIAAA